MSLDCPLDQERLGRYTGVNVRISVGTLMMSFPSMPVSKRGGERTFQRKLVRTYIQCSCILLHILLAYKYFHIVLVWNKELLNFIQCLYMSLNNFFPSLQM